MNYHQKLLNQYLSFNQVLFLKIFLLLIFMYGTAVCFQKLLTKLRPRKVGDQSAYVYK